MNSLRCSFLWLSRSRNLPLRLADGSNSLLRGLALCVAFGAVLTATAAAAVTYPAKPIRLIVPSAAGGNPDILGRLIASELSKQMGQQVVVDNRGGASGIIGFELIAKAVPDGYTFGMATFPIVTNPSAYAKLPYDTAKDFQPLIWQGSNGNFLTVAPSLPVRSIRELAEYARAQPGKLSYGSTGGGSSTQLSVELFKIMTGTQIVQISYKGMQQAITDVIAGQVHIACENAVSILPHIRAGRLRALGYTMLGRSLSAPDIPTIAEAGLPGYEMAPFSGYMAPARTPREIVLRLNAEINKALITPAFSEVFVANGGVIGGGTPEQFAEIMRRGNEKWGKVIKAAGMKPQ